MRPRQIRIQYNQPVGIAKNEITGVDGAAPDINAAKQGTAGSRRRPAWIDPAREHRKIWPTTKLVDIPHRTVYHQTRTALGAQVPAEDLPDHRKVRPRLCCDHNHIASLHLVERQHHGAEVWRIALHRQGSATQAQPRLLPGGKAGTQGKSGVNLPFGYQVDGDADRDIGPGSDLRIAEPVACVLGLRASCLFAMNSYRHGSAYPCQQAFGRAGKADHRLLQPVGIVDGKVQSYAASKLLL